MSRFSALVTIGLLATQGAGASVHRRWDSLEPLYKTDPGAPSDCSLWWNTDDGMPCDLALTIAGATEADLTRLNPWVKSCGDWEPTRSYCVKGSISSPGTGSGTDPQPTPGPAPQPEPVPSPTRPSTPTASPTKPSNGIETPQPIQPGMVDNCNKFQLVKKGQNCNEIARQAGITLAQFVLWNPEVGGTACSGLWADVNVCVGVVGTTPTTPTGPSNGIETPKPTQDGMVDNCNKFHLAVEGDNCWSVANKYGISEAQLHQWNKGIGGVACATMWTGYHQCIGVSGGGGGSQTQPPPASNTPQPIQDGMVGNCNKFHLVAAGDNCWNLASRYGLGESQPQQWNKGIGGTACNTMWTEYHVCVGVSGDGGSQTQPPPASNTPQPVQDGMVGNCKRFHFVEGGQNCEGISRTYGISVGDL
ncbi:hypothetical protein RB600_006079 [Gaeumannomyces tritici]